MYIKTSAFAHADYFDTLTNFEFDSHKHTKKALTINRQKSDSFLKFADHYDPQSLSSGHLPRVCFTRLD